MNSPLLSATVGIHNALAFSSFANEQDVNLEIAIELCREFGYSDGLRLCSATLYNLGGVALKKQMFSRAFNLIKVSAELMEELISLQSSDKVGEYKLQASKRCDISGTCLLALQDYTVSPSP